MPYGGCAERAALNDSTMRTMAPLTAFHNGHLQSGVHRMESPILFAYGVSLAGIAAAYGWQSAFFVAGKEINPLLTFLIPPLIIEIPREGN